MDKAYKPSGYNSLSPYLVVDGAQQMVNLLKEIFNAKEVRRYDNEDGTIMHVEIQIDDSVIMAGDSSEDFPPITQMLHVYVPNVDETFEKALESGCESIESPKQREGDPDKRGAFKDFAGNIWSVATQL